MPCVQDWSHDSCPDRSPGAFSCIIAQAGFLMNDPLRPAGFLQTAFTQAEGELRSKALFWRESVTATSAGSELPIASVGDGATDAVSNTAYLPHNPRVENDSIPIEHGPAQFNAFYPQCSAQNLASLHAN